MIKVKNDITSKQLFIFIVTCEIGTGIVTLPNQLAAKVGHDGWIPTLISGIISIFTMWIIMLLLKKYSDKSIFEINKLLYGKYIGGVFNVLLIIYTIFGACIILRRLADVVASQILKDTPSLVAGFFVMIPSAYLLYYGLTPICRVAYEVFFIISMTILIYLISFEDFDFMNLLPIGEAGVIPIMKTLKSTIYLYLGFELVAYIYPCVKDKENALKYAELAMLAVTIFFVITVVVVTGVFGENMLKRLNASLIFLSRIIDIPVIERIDLFFIILWLPLVACIIRNFIFSTYYGLEKIFAIKQRNIVITVIIIIVVLLSRIPTDFSQTEKFVDIFSIYALFVNAFLIICFIISLVKDKIVKN